MSRQDGQYGGSNRRNGSNAGYPYGEPIEARSDDWMSWMSEFRDFAESGINSGSPVQPLSMVRPLQWLIDWKFLRTLPRRQEPAAPPRQFIDASLRHMQPQPQETAAPPQPEETATAEAHSSDDDDDDDEVLECYDVGYAPYQPLVPHFLLQNSSSTGRVVSAVLCNRAAGHGGTVQITAEAKTTAKNVWVAVLTPKDRRHQTPVVMVHGDYHTGSVWDTDLARTQESRSWTECFLEAGFQVHLVDLPGARASVNAIPAETRQQQERPMTSGLSDVEANLTGVGNKGPYMYDSASRHAQFPGSGDKYIRAGWRQNAYFDYYASKRVGVWGTPRDRTAAGAAAAISILEGLLPAKAVLVAEGTGCEVAWMAGDRRPDLVAGIVALGAQHAPFAKTTSEVVARNGASARQFTGEEMTVRDRPHERWGIMDISVEFDPPLPDDDPRHLETAEYTNEDGDKCLLQDPTKTVRRLAQLSKISHAILTAEASINSGYDWAVVKYLQQAGVQVDWLKLAEFGLFGNGPLMFLEMNAAKIAELVVAWVVKTTSPGTDEATAAEALLAPSPENVAAARARRAEDRARNEARVGQRFIADLERYADSLQQSQTEYPPMSEVMQYWYDVGLGWLLPLELCRPRNDGGDGGGGGGDAN